jgi:hypothetical protein
MRAVYNPSLAARPPPPARTPRAGPPLTHHEIFTLVAPFTRQGLQVDLSSSDRSARELVFNPRQHPAAPDGSASLPALTETLVLDAGTDGRHALTRRLQAAAEPATTGSTLAPASVGASDPPLVATLELQGTDVAALLQQVLAVPPARHFQRGDGFLVALSLRAAPAGSHGASADGLFLARGEVRLDAAPGLRLSLRPPRVRGPSVDVELTHTDEHLPALPDDLLAVLGRGWSPLTRWRQGWRGTLRLRGSAMQRQARAGQCLQHAAAHLAQTLTAPPAAFHARHRAARWAVVLRRATPLLLGVAVCLIAWQVQTRDIASESVLKVIANIAPPLMLMAFFAMPEIPRVEIPPWPRARRAASWWP